MSSLSLRWISLLLASAVVAPGCSSPSSASSPPRSSGIFSDPHVVAVVNGTPIREVEVQYRLKTTTRETEMKPEFRRNLVEGIIQDELIAERARELGLDRDPAYLVRVAEMQSELDALRRKTLKDLYFRHELAAQAVVSDAEVRTYYEANQKRLAREVDVQQIFVRGEASARAAKAELAQGKPFEEVAAERVVASARAARPWRLNGLRGAQIPDSWRAPLETMKVGETSDVLRGPGDRAWIIRLTGERTATASFDELRDSIRETLSQQRVEESRRMEDGRLRARARIEYAPSLN